MKIHHLNCISSCPLGGHLMDDGHESMFERGRLTNHCLLVEDKNKLILIDTGYGIKDVLNPHSRLSEFFLRLNSPDFRLEMTARKQIENLGFDARDVKDIVLTHLDFDHAGGLDDFPLAKVHMLRSEKISALQQRTWLDRQRYRPQQWGTKDNWTVYETGEGDNWFGFEKVHALDGINTDIVMIPLIGHTLGHAGIAVKSQGKWFFNTGDAYFFHGEMEMVPHCTSGLKMYQNLMDKDHHMRVFNQERLRTLKRIHSKEVEIFCAHDVLEFERLAKRSAHIPPEHLINPLKTTSEVHHGNKSP